jgi:hypothetical protein
MPPPALEGKTKFLEPVRVRKAERPPELMRGKPRRRMPPPALEAK